VALFNAQFTQTEFIAEYWRKKSCVFFSTIERLPDIDISQLLALAADPLAESRLITDDYSLHLGPFDAQDEGLLMINGLDQHLLELEQLLQQDFGFLPRWRIDDVMASTGATGASTGAHFDHYDVFLVQLSGSKTWQIDDQHHVEADLDSSRDIRLLKEFTPSTTHELDPGDVLYIPPGIGHFGVNTSPGITLSIGVRNPTMIELFSDLSDFVMDQVDLTQMLDDTIQNASNGITLDDTTNIQQKMTSILNNDQLLADWYGTYSTRLRDPDLVQASNTFTNKISLHPAARLTWYADDTALRIYANGTLIVTTQDVLAWLKPLTKDRHYQFSEQSVEDHSVLAQMAELGLLRYDQ